jgi:hypothetical protein
MLMASTGCLSIRSRKRIAGIRVWFHAQTVP